MANIIKKFFTKEELDILQPYCKVRIQESRFLPSEEQSPYVPHFVDDPLGTVFHIQKKSLIEKHVGKSLNTTYVYWRYYGHGSILDMHTDRPACEWSVTACIDKTHDWPLIVKGEEIELRVGEGLIYNGVFDKHGRPGYFKGDGMAQMFMHYVDAKGPFVQHTNDEYKKQSGAAFAQEDEAYINEISISTSR